MAGRDSLKAEIRRLLRGRDAAAPVLAPRDYLSESAPAAAPAPEPAAASAPEPAAAPRPARPLDFSLMFFSAPAASAGATGLYDLVHRAARIADAQGFAAVWMPERHFHRFGGPYPDPAVLAASLAPVTERIRLRAGSVIATLDHPLRVVEAWAMVDNLSGGRVDISFGSGWNPNDFVLAPDAFADLKAVFRERVAQIRALWRGEPARFRNGQGEEVEVGVFPRPVQPELPVWISATGNPETFDWAGAQGFNLLTMVLGGDLDQLAGKIRRYRDARAAAGLDPAAGTVTLMLHSFVHADGDLVERSIRAPFLDYVRSSIDVQRHGSAEGKALTEAQREKMVGFAFERYRREASLFGTPDRLLDTVDRLGALEVDEIACLVDFGIDDDLVLDGLEHLGALRARHLERVRARDAKPGPAPATAPRADAGPIAVIGLSARFPGSPDQWAFWRNLRDLRDLTGPPPDGRWPSVTAPALPRGGFIDAVEDFEPARFRLAPSEAALMDPHHRLLLHAAWEALEDAGLRPSALRGSDTGVFVAHYSTSYRAARASADPDSAPDPLMVTGSVPSMAPNRLSHLFDWSGPSELVDTACSSGLVAVHRAAQALRSGECGLALAAGVSLLLSDAESAGLQRLGILSPSGECRAFDPAADGQVRGEGVGAVLLKPLAAAERDGDFVYGVIRGSAVNHGGARSGSLTLPSSHRQADCMVAAVEAAGVSADSLTYVEGHGAGTAAGDLSEISALGAAWDRLGAGAAARCAVGSVKANIGSLDAAGGLAALIKVLLALRHDTVPGMPARDGAGSAIPADENRFRLATETADWPEAGDPHRALVHAYGLGGVNADLVVEAHRDRRREAATADRRVLVVVSGASEAVLTENKARLRAYLDGDDPAALPDIAYSLLVGRELGPQRWHALVRSREDLARALDGEPAGNAVPDGPARELLDILARGEAPASEDVDRLQPGRRVPLPPGAFAAQRFPVADDGAPAGGADAVARFYDHVARAAHQRVDELYLTLAPFPEVVEGFSWTRTFQDPDRHRVHFELMQRRQREMRAVAFAGIEFDRVRRVLDIGCGFGTDLIVLAQRHPHLCGCGYTLSPEQAEAARARIAAKGLADRIEIHCRDSAADPFPERYDLVIGFEVAHHVADKDGLFANIAAHLADDGRVVLADCVANTVAPVNLAAVGSFTPTREDYAALLARHGLVIADCLDASREIGNFLHDPGLESMLQAEAGRDGAVRADIELAAAVQRSWDAFGEALRTGLMNYLLVTAMAERDRARAERVNRQQLGGA